MEQSNEAKGDEATAQQAANDSHGEDDADAAKTIQRNYRGYKSRREMKGCGMSAQFRWQELLKDGITQRHSSHP
jgi:hypothetical protein